MNKFLAIIPLVCAIAMGVLLVTVKRGNISAYDATLFTILGAGGATFVLGGILGFVLLFKEDKIKDEKEERKNRLLNDLNCVNLKRSFSMVVDTVALSLSDDLEKYEKAKDLNTRLSLCNATFNMVVKHLIKNTDLEFEQQYVDDYGYSLIASKTLDDCRVRFICICFNVKNGIEILKTGKYFVFDMNEAKLLVAPPDVNDTYMEASMTCHANGVTHYVERQMADFKEWGF